MSNGDIEWGDPPPSFRKNRRYELAAIAEQLRQRPGEWALIRRVGHNKSGSIIAGIKGMYLSFRPMGHFEATQRRLESGEVGVYARYVGGEDDE